MTTNTIFIFCGNKCNFSCNHCIASSSPQSTLYSLSDKDITIVIEALNLASNLKNVHFVGGEPSLYLEKIAKLQSMIGDNYTYSMTTNGSWYSKIEAILSTIKLHSVNLSYHRFHSMFISRDNLLFLAASLRDRGVKVCFQIAISELAELLEYAEFVEAGFEIIPLSIVEAGRATKQISFSEKDPNIIDKSCVNASVTTGRSKIYYPGVGFSICCGPLFFSRNGPTREPKIVTNGIEDSELEAIML